jgi:hypothetical protein
VPKVPNIPVYPIIRPLVEMSGYVPPVVRRAAAAAGVSVEEYRAQLAAAEAPRNLGVLAPAAPRKTRTSSDRRRKGAMRKSGAKTAKTVRIVGRRVRIHQNTGAGVDEVHPRHVDPYEEDDLRSSPYRMRRAPTPVPNIHAFHQRQRRKTLTNVRNRMANVHVIDAMLEDLSARNSLSAEDAMAIAAIRDRLHDI